MSLFRRRLLVGLLGVTVLVAPSCVDGTEQSLHHVGNGEPLDVTVFVDQIESERQNRTERLAGAAARPDQQSAASGLPEDLAFVEAPASGDNRLSERSVDDGDGLPEQQSSPAESDGAEEPVADASATAAEEASANEPSAETPTDGVGASIDASGEYTSQPADR